MSEYQTVYFEDGDDLTKQAQYGWRVIAVLPGDDETLPAAVMERQAKGEGDKERRRAITALIMLAVWIAGFVLFSYGMYLMWSPLGYIGGGMTAVVIALNIHNALEDSDG